MVSIQTNFSISSDTNYNSFRLTGKTGNKKYILNSSTNHEVFQFSSKITTGTRQNVSDQNAIFHFSQLSREDKASLLYNNRPISELSVDQANDLISDDGYFGIAKTSQRIIDFVIKGAGNDIDRLRAGREGVLRGFAQAEKAWGGKLPDISYATLEKSLDAIEERIRQAGEPVVKLSV